MAKCRCDNCGHVCEEGKLKESRDLDQRLDYPIGHPLCVEPAGDCPKCGCFSYPVSTKKSVAELREQAQASANEAQKITKKAAEDQAELENAVCKQAGVSTRYLDLIRSVMSDPVTGAYSASYSRILGMARKKKVVKPVFGGVHSISSKRHAGCSGNSWYELDTLGIKIMADLNGPSWTYDAPSAGMNLKAAA